MYGLAWFAVITVAINLLFEPFVFGKPRHAGAEYGPKTWTISIIEAAILIPLCGRIIGWW